MSFISRGATTVAALMIFAALRPINSFSAETIKIGFAAPLTGALANFGKGQQNGALLAVEDINKIGLMVDGKRVVLELDSQDDAADPRTATQVAQRLVDDDVVAVVGHMLSGTSIAASKIYSEASVAEISPSATNPAFTTQGLKTTFRLVATDLQQGPALAEFAYQSLHAKTVAIVDDSTAYGKGLADQFEKSAKATGLTVISHDAVNEHTTDFRAILTTIKGERAGVIMYAGADATGGPFAKQAAQLAIRSKIIGGDGICSEKLPELAGPAVDNVTCSEAAMPVEKLPGGSAFLANFQKRFDEPIQLYAAQSYDAVHIIVDAMKRAKSVERAKLLAELPSTAYEGVIGPIKFKPNGDIQNSVVSLYSYKNGKKLFLEKLKN
ncbi:branched-chain amino acid ABC transporter substrate-binding protein [Caballeronia sordidicola]